MFDKDYLRRITFEWDEQEQTFYHNSCDSFTHAIATKIREPEVFTLLHECIMCGFRVIDGMVKK